MYEESSSRKYIAITVTFLTFVLRKFGVSAHLNCLYWDNRVLTLCFCVYVSSTRAGKTFLLRVLLHLVVRFWPTFLKTFFERYCNYNKEFGGRAGTPVSDLLQMFWNVLFLKQLFSAVPPGFLVSLALLFLKPSVSQWTWRFSTFTNGQLYLVPCEGGSGPVTQASRKS